jgi:hypothetical protein
MKKRNSKMPLWMQHTVVLLLVGACCAYCLWGAISTLIGRRSKIGSCCAKGCQTSEKAAQPQSAVKTHFLPAELLVSSKRKNS